MGKTFVAAFYRTAPWLFVRVGDKVALQQTVAYKPFGTAFNRADPGFAAAVGAHMYTRVRLPFEPAGAAFKLTAPGPVVTVDAQMLLPAGDGEKASGAAFDKADPGLVGGMNGKMTPLVGGGPELFGAARKRTGPEPDIVGLQVLVSVVDLAKAPSAACNRAGISCALVIGQTLAGTAGGLLRVGGLAGSQPGLEPDPGSVVHVGMVFQAGSAAEYSQAILNSADILFRPAAGPRSLCRCLQGTGGLHWPGGSRLGRGVCPSFLDPECEHGQHPL